MKLETVVITLCPGIIIVPIFDCKMPEVNAKRVQSKTNQKSKKQQRVKSSKKRTNKALGGASVSWTGKKVKEEKRL